MERAIAYLDLLGFKDFMIQDKEGAISLLWSFDIALEMIKGNATSFSSFEYFLPFSDSLIITSREPTADLFLKQIGRLILKSFLSTGEEYSTEEYPKIVENEHDIDRGDGTFEKKIVKVQQFPVLFRGGIAFGDVEILEKCAVISRKFGESYCVAGSPVIRAVALERTIKMPGLIFEELIYQKIVGDDMRNRYVYKEGDRYGLLWPALYFIEGNDPVVELQKFSDIFIPAVNLWKTYSHINVADLYFNFLKLIVKSTYSFFKNKLSEESIASMINNQLVEANVEYKKLELLKL